MVSTHSIWWHDTYTSVAPNLNKMGSAPWSDDSKFLMLEVIRVEICQLQIAFFLYLLVAKLLMKMLKEPYSSVGTLFTKNLFKN